MTLALMACGSQHMALAVMLGNTRECHVMRCSTRHQGHSAGRRLLTISAVKQDLHALPERVDVLGFLDEGVPLLYQNTGGTSEAQSETRPCGPAAPALGWGCAPETATLPPQPWALGFPLHSPSTRSHLGSWRPASSRKQPHKKPGCSDSLPTHSLLLPLSTPWVEDMMQVQSVHSGLLLSQRGRKLGECSLGGQRG